MNTGPLCEAPPAKLSTVLQTTTSVRTEGPNRQAQIPNATELWIALTGTDNCIAACSDLSHHLMGRWHYEMAQLNMMVRTLIRVAFGTNLPSGTTQDALASYQQAAKLNPTCVAHHVEIGRCLSKMGRRPEAIASLKVRISI